MRLLARRPSLVSLSLRYHQASYSRPALALFRPRCAISPNSYSPNLSRIASLASLSTSTMTVSALGPDWKHVPSDDSTPPFHAYTKPVRKSAQDDRDYRVIKLRNGLQAMLVHDPKADKAAASLDVAVGHLYDPVSLRTQCMRGKYMTNATQRMICQVLLIFASTFFSW